MAIKVTFTLDDATIEKLNETAERLSKPKSQVVREAIENYHANSDRLSEAERQRLLRGMDELLPRIPKRPLKEVERELKQIRLARRSGGRLHPSN